MNPDAKCEGILTVSVLFLEDAGGGDDIIELDGGLKGQILELSLGTVGWFFFHYNYYSPFHNPLLATTFTDYWRPSSGTDPAGVWMNCWFDD